MKYIDGEKLKSIIKVQINGRKEWMKDIDRSDRQDQLWSDLNGEDMSILQIIDSLQQEQPSLPDNLDEEAEETAKKYYCSCLEKHNETGICDWCENVKLSFKAGAEWMAGQGLISEGIINQTSGEDTMIELNEYIDNLEDCEEVIVNIRKKEENHD